MSKKAIIIDLKKTIRALDKDEDYLQFFETSDTGMLPLGEITPETQLQIVDAVRKIYKKIILSIPKRGGRIQEAYYVNIEDWEKVMPFITGMIADRTADLNAEINTLRNIIEFYTKYTEDIESKWYVRAGRFIMRLFKKEK